MCGECGCYGEWRDDLIEDAEEHDCLPSELPYLQDDSEED